MAITGFSVRYGDVIFSDVQTMDFREQAFRDPSGTDIIYLKARHHFSSYLWQNTKSSMGAMDARSGTGKAGPVATITKTTLLQLMRDRQDYEWLFGGEPLLSVKASSDGNTEGLALLALENGPKISDVRFTEFSPKAIRCEVVIDLAYARCESGSGIVQNTHGAAFDETNMVLSNRWSVTDQADSDFYWVSQVEGTLRVAHREFFPHCYRHLVVPPLRPNYQRVGQSFTQTEDGLGLRYQIADKQQPAAPPRPATNWKCRHGEQTAKFGYKTFSTFNITLRGAPGGKKSDLFAAAARAAEARLGGLQRELSPPKDPSDIEPTEDPIGANTQVIPVMAEFIDDVDENQISLAVAVERVSVDANDRETDDANPITKYLNLTIQRSDEVFHEMEGGYDRRFWPRPGFYDSASPAGIFSTYLQSPCDNVKGITAPVFCTVQQLKPERDDKEQEKINDEEDQDGERGVTNDPNGKFAQSREWYTHIASEGHYMLVDSGWVHPAYARAKPDGPTVAAIKLHSGIWHAEFRVNLERAGAWPPVLNLAHPFTSKTGINFYPRPSHVSPAYPLETSTGKLRKYGVEAVYRFTMDRPPKLGDELSAGFVPIETETMEAFFKANEKNFLPAGIALGLADAVDVGGGSQS